MKEKERTECVRVREKKKTDTKTKKKRDSRLIKKKRPQSSFCYPFITPSNRLFDTLTSSKIEHHLRLRGDPPANTKTHLALRNQGNFSDFPPSLFFSSLFLFISKLAFISRNFTFFFSLLFSQITRIQHLISLISLTLSLTYTEPHLINTLPSLSNTPKPLSANDNFSLSNSSPLLILKRKIH